MAKLLLADPDPARAAALAQALQAAGHGTGRDEVQGVTRTIEGRVDRLLLSAASDSDEGHMAHSGATSVEDR